MTSRQASPDISREMIHFIIILYDEYAFFITLSRTGTKYMSSPDNFLAALARIGGLFALIKILSMSMSLTHEAMFIRELDKFEK